MIIVMIESYEFVYARATAARYDEIRWSVCDRGEGNRHHSITLLWNARRREFGLIEYYSLNTLTGKLS